MRSQLLDTINQSKTNMIKDLTSHFGSEVQYYSYGKKGSYGIVNGYSAGC